MRTTRRARREARRLFRMCVVDGVLDEGRALTVVTRLAEARRRGSLGLLAHFQRLAKLDRASHRAVVESATPLPSDLSARVEAEVLRLYGAGLDLSFVDNPALIGGMRVKVGSDVYDGSVRSALAALEDRFQ
jgi:F-type H+-transporting ATPase subunit delta